MNAGTLWSAEEVLRTIRGSSLHEQSWVASSVSADLASLRPGGLYIALDGIGHENVAAAFAAGAVSALVSHQPLHSPTDAPLVFVDDTRQALRDLGELARKRTRAKIIAIAGSVGKSTAQDMLHLCLGAVGKVFSAPFSVCQSQDLFIALANMPFDADYALFEISGSKAEVASLSFDLGPDLALITGSDEPEDSLAAEESAEIDAGIFAGMNAKAVVVVHKNGSRSSRLAALAKNAGIKDVVSYGAMDSGANAEIIARALSDNSSNVEALLGKQRVRYALSVPGPSMVLDALGALYAAHLASGKLQECAAALLHYKPRNGFGSAEELVFDDGVAMLIDDSHHATFASTAAALDTLSRAQPTSSGRRILVLSDMTGAALSAPDLHVNLAPRIQEAKVDLVFCCGEMTRYLYDNLPADLRGGYALDAAELAPLVAREVHAGDVIMVKGTASMALNAVVGALRSLPLQLQTSVSA